MKEYQLICLLLFCSINYSLSILVDEITAMSWPLVGIQLKIVCSELSVDAGVTWEQIERKFYKLDKQS
jgi:hypothetical protein